MSISAQNELLHRGFEEFASFVNPVAALRARLSGEPVQLVRVLDGNSLQDVSGKVYEDYLSGYGTQALGHRNPQIAQALRDYLETDAPSFFPSGISPFAGRLAKQLATRTGYGNVSFASSGTEAVESALKLARSATGKTRIFGLSGAYHGCTFGSLSLMQRGPFSDPFAPFLRGVEILPFSELDPLAAALSQADVAAVIVEPIQIEGGVRSLPTDYLSALCTLCERHGVLLIADEVQTGLCRTGRFLASESWPRKPDVVVLAKSLGGGLVPLSAMLTHSAMFQRAYGTFVTAESHQYTFSGNALACVAGMAALPLYSEELAAQVRRRGDRFRQALAEALSDSPLVKEVRGAGLLVGIELHPSDHPWLSFEALGLPELSGQPSVGMLLCHRLFRRGYLTHVAGHQWRVVRLQPSLLIENESLQRFVLACKQEVQELADLL